MTTLLHPPTKTLTLAAVLIMAAPTAHAIGFGDMFNPGRWFGGGDDDYYYDEGPWGPYGPGPYGGVPGYAPYGGYGGYAPYGAPGYGAPGYGAPGYGAPAPGYGAPAYSAPAQTAPTPSAPSRSDGAKDKEIEALKRRIEQLEARGGGSGQAQPRQAPDSGAGYPSAPAFRPMDQY